MELTQKLRMPKINVFTKEFIRKARHPHPYPLPSREGRGDLSIAPPLRGGDKGEGV